MAVNIPGAISVAVFYVIILVSGIVAGRKTNRGTSNESILVADRSLNIWIAVLTIAATGVGGAFINGIAEAAAASGLYHSQPFFGYSFGLIPAGLFFAPKMRKENYVTMFDPFQMKYGKKVAALLFVPQFFGDLFWSAATLSALGATISIILDIDSTLAIIVSAVVAIFYTFFGGLYAVAYTDVFQLAIIGIGLIIAFPFCLTHESVSLYSRDHSIMGEVPVDTIIAFPFCLTHESVSLYSRDHSIMGEVPVDTIIAFPFCLTHESVSLHSRDHSIMGEVPVDTVGSYLDVWLLCLGGGVPWQALYQRVLACKTVWIAKISTVSACFVILLLSSPAVIIGIAGGAADWNATSYGESLKQEDYAFILPLSLSYLAPTPVSILGIGAMAAAVMSSADSCFLSSSTVMTKNIYQDIFRPQATSREIVWCLRISIVVFGTLAAVVAVTVKTIYGLFVLCGDLMYVVLLPQLTAVLWMKAANAYGCVSGFLVAFLLRILCGEPILGLPSVMKLPLYDEESETQHFPYRSLVMAVGTLTLVVVSLATQYLFTNDVISRRYDVLKICRQKTIHTSNGGDNNKKASHVEMVEARA